MGETRSIAGKSSRYVLVAVRARTWKGPIPIRRGERNKGDGRGVCTVSSSTAHHWHQLRVPPEGVELRLTPSCAVARPIRRAALPGPAGPG